MTEKGGNTNHLTNYDNKKKTGRYYEKVITDVDGFKKWWTTVAKLFATNDKVVFDTNNEYHDMDNSLVQRLNQAAIDGIRAAGATTQYIFVEGNSWSGAWTWVSKNLPLCSFASWLPTKPSHHHPKSISPFSFQSEPRGRSHSFSGPELDRKRKTDRS